MQNPFGLIRIKVFIYCFICVPIGASAQLVVSDVVSPQELVENVLAGPGIQPSNVTFNQIAGSEANTQIGSFSGGLGSIGIESGIIIATGQVAVAQSPNDLPSAFIPLPDGEELGTDPDLEQIIGPVAIRDVAKLEFDFLATGDTLKFRFVFASDEYNEYTCSSYNDAFGFFIHGPGIPGDPNYENNARNIALIPGTSVPIGINTVNQGFAGSSGAAAVCNANSPGWMANSIFYTNNENNSNPNTTQFDGYTVPFAVEIPVICGETYHIKLAIADAVDRKNDSAVFIEAGSFTSAPPLEAELQISNPDGPNTALEGCSTYALNLSRPNAGNPATVYLRTAGLADPEQVLGQIPDSIVFEPGETDRLIPIATANNGSFDGPRNFNFEIRQAESCALDTFLIVIPTAIQDRTPLLLDYPDSIWVACDAMAEIDILADGGNPPYDILWQSAEIDGFNPTFDPEESAVFTAQVTDQCSLNVVSLSIIIEKEAYPPLSLLLPESLAYDCTEPVVINPILSGGAGEYTYAWTAEGEEISTEQNLNALIADPGILQLTVSDRCSAPVSGAVNLVLQNNPLSVDLGPDENGNCDSPLLILPDVLGGFGELEYQWFENQSLVHDGGFYYFTPSQTISLRLMVADGCGQSDQDTLYVFVNNPDIQISMPEDTLICAGTRFNLLPEVTGGQPPYGYFWPETGSLEPEISFILVRESTFTIEVTDLCGETARASTRVALTEVEAAFEFDYGSPFNPIQNYSTPDCQYAWLLPDGTISSAFEPPFTPVKGSVNRVFLAVTSAEGCTDDAELFYDPPISIFIPNAFTPDGDGINDVFKAEGQHVQTFEMSVFDRWGNRVFHTDRIDQGWRGEGAADSDFSVANDTYNYQYMATTWTGEVVRGSGTVQLLR